MSAEERTIKEYPHSTRWIEGRKTVGLGNLILTSRRLMFLHQVDLDEPQIAELRRMSEGAPPYRMANIALGLHKKNFQIPLTAVVSAKMGLYTWLPFPRPCLRITYERRTGDVRIVSFMFTISILKGFFQTELADVLSWVMKIRKAVREAEQT